MDEMQKIQYAANSYYNRGLEMAKERNLSGAARFLKRALQFNKYHTDARNLLEQGFSGFRVVPVLHVEKRQKQMRFHEIRLLVDNPLKLQDRQIITVILGIE